MTIKKTIIISILTLSLGLVLGFSLNKTQAQLILDPSVTITDKVLTLQEAETACEMVDKEVCEIIGEEEICSIIQEEVCEDIPEKKDFQVNFIYKLREGGVTVNFDGYNRCREKGSNRTFCLAQLHNQIEKNIQWWKEGEDARILEEQIKDFSSELKPADF
jgi:hypothetical protein